jgi:predicted permease
VFSLAFGCWVLPDGPLDVALLAFLYAVIRALGLPQGQAAPRWWLAAGLCAGLALLSKYSAVLVLAGAALAVLSDPLSRRELRRFAPWLAVLLALLLFTPALYWNATHGWASFHYQGGRATGLRLRPFMPFSIWGGEALFLLPWLWLPMVWLMLRGFAQGPGERRGWLLAWAAVLPVVLFAFGREALAHATVYYVVNAVAIYTLGIVFASAGRHPVGQALRGVLRVPAVWAVAAAAVVMALGIRLPAAVMRPVELLSGAALPAMILVLGMQIERGARPERPLLVAVAGLLALVVTPAIAFGASHLFGVTGAARQAAVLQSGMPSAVLTTVLALEFDLASSFVTACVVLTTLVSPVTVTLLIAALQR